MGTPVLGKPSKRGVYDSNLVLRAAAAAAITTVGGDPASPDWASSSISLGDGVTNGHIVINNLAITLDGANDTIARLQVFGTDGTNQALLSELDIGCKEVTGNTADTATGDKGLTIPFSTLQGGVQWPQIFLQAVTDGTSISLDFTAYATTPFIE